MLNTQISQEEEQWRSRPEAGDTAGVGGYVLYYRLNPPTEEFYEVDFGVEVGTCMPDLDPDAGYTADRVLLGINSSMGTRLTNVLFEPKQARQLATHLLSAADAAERQHAASPYGYELTPEEERELLDRTNRTRDR